jgi:predicted outer membrane repeat protein
LYKIQLDLAPGQSLKEIVEAYQSNPDVEYAEFNYVVSIRRTSPNDPLYPIQWPLNNVRQMYPESGRYNHPPGRSDSDIDAPEAWDITTAASDVIVAVLDTGVDYTHRDLNDNMWVNQVELDGIEGVDDDENGYIDDIYGYDFINRDPDPKDDHGHGTHCSGIIAAEGDNELDIAGVCWDAQIMALKFLGSDGGGDAATAVGAVYYAVENGADIISNSWGGSWFYPKSLKQAFDYAYSQGVIAVASAGNDDSDWISYPASFERVIAVAATNSRDSKAPFSNYGLDVDIAAPGVDVLSLRAAGTSMGTVYDGFTTVASGTSMACPHVSGAFALLLSLYPDIDIDQAKDIIMQTTDPIAPDICISGRLNLYNALWVIVGFYTGSVYLSSDVYSCSDTVHVLLSDLNLAGNAAQQITVSTTGGDSETLVLVSTDPAWGIFSGTISTESADPNLEDGTLQLSHGETITATYEDEDDGTGNPITITDTATADCEPPVIFNVQIDVPGPDPRVTFETNEPTLASVLCGPVCGGPYQLERLDTELSVTHAVELTGVLPYTDYFFVVRAYDVAGNETTDNNNSLCYAFTTTGPCDMYVPSQYPDIQEAINRAWEGSTIWIAEGRYTGEGNRDIDFLGKAITVCGADPNDPEVIAATIIDCNGTKAQRHRGFYFHSGEDTDSVLAGLTITNGYQTGGGAILCQFSDPTITNCIFRDNRAKYSGGAILCTSASPTITNCTLTANVTQWGGAIYTEDSNVTIANCIVTGNKAETAGGGLWCDIGIPKILNCTIVGNLGGFRGGGLVRWWTGGRISNCIIWNNSARRNPQLSSGVNPTYSCIEDWSGAGLGNISADPCFVDSGFWDTNGTPEDATDDFWVQGDYHLRSKGWRWDAQTRQWTWDDVTSRCIDAGNPGSELAGEALTLDVDPLNRCGQNLRINMGAYGGTKQASMPPYDWAVVGDLTNDGTVDFLDLEHWTQGWLNNGREWPGDMDRNETVDLFDYALFIRDWSLETIWH